jgi:hypothetical protein
MKEKQETPLNKNTPAVLEPVSGHVPRWIYKALQSEERAA